MFIWHRLRRPSYDIQDMAYISTPGTMPVGRYLAGCMLVDLDTAEFNGPEDIDVREIARQRDMTIVRQIELGQWWIMNKQMIFSASDKVTPLLTFNLKVSNSVYARFGGQIIEMKKGGMLKCTTTNLPSIGRAVVK